MPFENLDICDACVIGEGEQTFAEIISENPADWDKIKGIALLKDGMPYKTSLLHIHDDNFTGSRERVMEFCEIKQRRYPRLKWICYVFEPKNDSTVGGDGNPVEAW